MASERISEAPGFERAQQKRVLKTSKMNKKCIDGVKSDKDTLQMKPSRLMFAISLVTQLIFLLCLLVPAARAQFFGGEPIGGSNGPVGRFPGPQNYRDSATGITFYVESDGLHVAAISKKGKILWVRDPFHDARLSDYRTHKPQIVFLGKGSWTVNGVRRRDVPAILVWFNSSQFGAMKMSDGEFQFQGQD